MIIPSGCGIITAGLTSVINHRLRSLHRPPDVRYWWTVFFLSALRRTITGWGIVNRFRNLSEHSVVKKVGRHTLWSAQLRALISRRLGFLSLRNAHTIRADYCLFVVSHVWNSSVGLNPTWGIIPSSSSLNERLLSSIHDKVADCLCRCPSAFRLWVVMGSNIQWKFQLFRFHKHSVFLWAITEPRAALMDPISRPPRFKSALRGACSTQIPPYLCHVFRVMWPNELMWLVRDVRCVVALTFCVNVIGRPT